MLVRSIGIAAVVSALCLTSTVMAQMLPDEVDPENAASACGMDDAVTIDARQIPLPAVLAEEVENAGAQAIVIAGGKFNGEDFTQFASSLAGACFYRTQLSSTDWRGANMSGSKFVASDLGGADLREAKIDGSQFIGVNLSQAQLEGASLVDSEWIGDFWLSNLEKADFSNATMRGFKFRCTILMYQSCGVGEGTDFSGADLSGADISTLSLWGDARLNGARLDGAWIDPQAVPYLKQVVLADGLAMPSAFDEDGDPADPIRVSADEFAILQAETEKVDRNNASFDCAAAASFVEKEICGEWQFGLRELDRTMAAVYREAREAGVVDIASQRAWLKTRDACRDAECIKANYEGRLNRLFAALGDRWMLAPDESRTFHAEVLPVSDEFRKSELYVRIVPALRLSSWQHVTLTGREDGSAAGEGSAIGANAHMCGFGTDEARFDPASGWYASTTADGQKVPLFRIWGDRLFMRYSGNMGDTPDEAYDFISCGARASFGEMLDLDGR